MNWVNFFPFLYTFSGSKNRKILLNFEDNILKVYFLRHLNSSSRLPVLQLYFIPIPFSTEALKSSLEIIKMFNSSSSTIILWCDSEDINNIRSEKEFDKLIKFKYKEDEFIYSPLDYENLSGGKFRYLRQQISLINRLGNVKVVEYERKYLKSCLSLYDNWKDTQKDKYESIEDETYTKLCLYDSYKFPKDILNGIVILVDDEVKSFAFYGKITNTTANMFIGKSDHNIKGLQSFMRYQVLLRLKNYEYVNDGGGSLSKGLYESKRKFRASKMHKIYKARYNMKRI